MTLQNILTKHYKQFFPDSGSSVHGESNDTLTASNRPKLVEKLSSAETYLEKTLTMGARILNKIDFEIDLLRLPMDFKNSFCVFFSGFDFVLWFSAKKLHKKILIGKSENRVQYFFQTRAKMRFSSKNGKFSVETTHSSYFLKPRGACFTIQNWAACLFLVVFWNPGRVSKICRFMTKISF